MNLLNGILVDAPMTPKLLNDLSLTRWRLRTHIHEDPKQCTQCLQDLIMIGQYINSLFNHIDFMEEKMATYRKAARMGRLPDLEE